MAGKEPLEDHVFEIRIAVDRSRVWEEITKTGRVQRAMHNTVLECELRPGAKMRYYSPDRRRVFVVGEVVEILPPSRLSHTFKFTMRPDEEPTLVTWELEPIEGGCRVVLTHSRWTDQRKTHRGVPKGWMGILDTLKHELETGDIPLKVKLTHRIAGALSFLLPRSTRVEEVSRTGW